MGVHLNVYYGPYLKVSTVIKQETHMVLTCVNTKCDKHLKESSKKYCSDCGNQIQPLDQIKEYEQSLYDFLEKNEFVDLLSNNEYIENIWMVNNWDKFDDYCKVFSSYDNENPEFNLSKINIQNAILDFEKDFKTVIDKATEDGYNPIINYGIINYWA